MKQEFLLALQSYIDAKIKYELACLEVGSDGQTDNPVAERKAMEASLKELTSVSSSN